MIDNNLHPVFYMSRAAIPAMTARAWGRILAFGMADADQLTAQPNLTAHYIAKTGVLVLVRSLARMLGAYGITVNTVLPGLHRLRRAAEGRAGGDGPQIPAGYIGSLDDAVATARFLLSEEARYVNGTNVHLSGGWGI